MHDFLLNPFAIFDMDGTLINTNQFLDTITFRFFDKRNTPYTEEFLRRTKTMSKPAYCREVKELTGSAETLEEIADEVDFYMMDVYKHDAQLMPNALTYLKILQQRGIRMCVASATGAEAVEYVLDRLNVLSYFDFVLSAEDVGKDKDEPDLFLESARRLGAASPAQATVYEDSPVAALCAKKAGFSVVGFLDDADKISPEDFAARCTLSVRNFEELLKIFNA